MVYLDFTKKSSLLTSITVTAIVFSFSLFVILPHSIYAQNISDSYNKSSLLSSGLNSLFKSLLSQNLTSLKKDISGHYNNTEFGIKDIVFPKDWHGREIASVLGLTVSMHPGSLSEHQATLAALFNQSNQTKTQPLKPSITLQVINNDQINKIGIFPMDVSYSKYCKQLEQNSTSTIDGKVFNVMKIECPLSSLISNMFSSTLNNKENNTSLQSNNSSTSNNTTFHPNNSSLGGNLLSQSKIFEYKTPAKTYRLALSVSNSIFTPSVEKPDINKYNSIIEDVVKTLKID